MIDPTTPPMLAPYVYERLRDLRDEAAQERLLRLAKPAARPLPRAETLPRLVRAALPAALCCPQAA